MRIKNKTNWQWQEAHKWVQYAPKDEAAIENGYQARLQVPTITLVIQGKQYIIDFQNMKQINQQTNFSRSIRRQTIGRGAQQQQQQFSSPSFQVQQPFLSASVPQQPFLSSSVQQQQFLSSSVQQLPTPQQQSLSPVQTPLQTMMLRCEDGNGQDFAHSLSTMSAKHVESYCANICSWVPLSPPVVQQKFKEDRCSICLCEFEEDEEVVAICDGSHAYHKPCLIQCLDKTHGFIKCAICNKIYGVRKGNMPNGTMKIRKLPIQNNEGLQLEGYEGKCGVIVIDYHFPSGIQGPEHPHPGIAYQGTSRTAYLPDDPVGNKVLKMLVLSFQRRLTFTVGRSVTQNRDNLVIWNNIHHKTNTHGGSVNFAFPDPTYFDRVLTEFQDKGITEADIADM